MFFTRIYRTHGPHGLPRLPILSVCFHCKRKSFITLTHGSKHAEIVRFDFFLLHNLSSVDA
jgi:hypothetical protein